MRVLWVTVCNGMYFGRKVEWDLEDEIFNLYGKAAKYYDYDNRDNLIVDIPFYLEYARRTGGEILELGCGTGRVAILSDWSYRNVRKKAGVSQRIYGIDSWGNDKNMIVLTKLWKINGNIRV